MSIITSIFGTGDVVNAVGTAIDKVSGVVDKFVLTKQEKFDAEQVEAERDFRFKQYEADNFQKEQDRLVQLYQADATDRQSARDYAKVEIASEDKFISHFRYWFAAGISFCIIGLLAGLLFHKLPQENDNITMFVLGTLSTTFTTIVSFYFGSSQGSSMKSSTIDKQLNQQSNIIQSQI